MNNFWNEPDITSLRIGDMASTSGRRGLQSSSSFCSWSPGLTTPREDPCPNFVRFKMANSVEIKFVNDDLNARELGRKLNLFFVKSQ